MKILKNKESDPLEGKCIKSRSETWTQFYKIFNIKSCEDAPHWVGFCYCNDRREECPKSEKKYITLLDIDRKEYLYCYYHDWIVKDLD